MVEFCKTFGIHILNGRYGIDKNVGHLTCKDASAVDYFIVSTNLIQASVVFQVLDFDTILSDAYCPLFLHIGDFNVNSAGLQIYGGPEPLPYDLKIRHITFQGSGPR